MDSCERPSKRVKFSDKSELHYFVVPSDDDAPPCAHDDAPPCASDDAKTTDGSVTVVTKTTDGPAMAVLAARELLIFLLSAKKIKRSKVFDLLEPFETRDGVVDDGLKERVISLLENLQARIKVRGRASLLPCTTRLGRPFIPAIQFLVGSIKLGKPACDAVPPAE